MTIADLRAVGLNAKDVYYRVQVGRLHPVFRGVYSLGGPPQGDRQWWMACVLACGEGAELSHSAAAELYGWLRFPLGQRHVTAPGARRSRDGITVHCRRRPSSRRRIDGIPVTGPERTILDCATVIDNDRAYRRIVRQAQVEGETTHARLLVFAAANSGARGIKRLRAELAEGPSPTRSSFEDDVLAVFRSGETPIPNAVVAGYEVDLYFPRQRIVIEVDGPVHDNPTSRADDAAKQAALGARGLRVLRMR